MAGALSCVATEVSAPGGNRTPNQPGSPWVSTGVSGRGFYAWADTHRRGCTRQDCYMNCYMKTVIEQPAALPFTVPVPSRLQLLPLAEATQLLGCTCLL